MMKAWITLLTKPDYLLGVQTLQQSLRDQHSRYPLVVMVTPTITPDTRQALELAGCIVREVSPLRPREGIDGDYAWAQFSEVWTKLCAWQQDDFQRVVFLDADMLVVNNMDEVFDMPLAADSIAACHACRCNPNSIASYPDNWQPENCFYTHLARGEDAASAERKADYFNSGFMVLTPDRGVFAQLLQSLAAIDDVSEYPFPEQDLLNHYFRDRWHTLPFGYNALKTLGKQHPAIWRWDQVKNLHFILEKPWNSRPNDGKSDPAYAELLALWWQTADKVHTAPHT